MKSLMLVSTECLKVTSDSRMTMTKKSRKKHRYATSLPCTQMACKWEVDRSLVHAGDETSKPYFTQPC